MAAERAVSRESPFAARRSFIFYIMKYVIVRSRPRGDRVDRAATDGNALKVELFSAMFSQRAVSGKLPFAAWRAVDRAVSRAASKVNNMHFVLSVLTARQTARRRMETLSALRKLHISYVEKALIAARRALWERRFRLWQRFRPSPCC